jgi:hypothetical protein
VLLLSIRRQKLFPREGATMALLEIDRIRRLIGDDQPVQILSDTEIQEYLDFYEGDVGNSVVELREVMLLEVARRGTKDRVGDLWTDNSGQADDYRNALEALEGLRGKSIASKVAPIISTSGGSPRFQIGMFTETEV